MPFYLAFNIYLLVMALRWMGHLAGPLKSLFFRIPFTILYLLGCCSMGIAFFLEPGFWQKILKYVGNIWIGVDVFSILILLPIGIIRLLVFAIMKKAKGRSFKELRAGFRKTFLYRAVGMIVFLGVAGCTVFGIFNGYNIKINPYEVNIDKTAGKTKQLKIAMIGDMHMGYNVGVTHMKQMVKKINALEPDIILIAGDIFDNEYEAMDDPEQLIEVLQGLESRLGVYSVYGNHDIQEKILAGFTFDWKGKKQADERMDAFVEKCGFHHLRDQAVLVDNSFYLIGRADEERPGKGIDERAAIDELMQKVDPSLPVFVLDHEPKELKEQAAAGVDFCMNGHVHDGQVFPGNLLMDIMWDNSCGYKQFGDMHSIVTSGVGVWGPPMRIGTDSEICEITVNFR